MVVEVNRPSQETDGYQVYPYGDIVLAVFPRGGYGVLECHLTALYFFQALELLAENDEVDEVSQ